MRVRVPPFLRDIEEKGVVMMTISGAPKDEPLGYRAAPGFVKTNPENNDYYVQEFEGHPWYPAIKYAHEELSRVVPGYNVVQIKEKFGGLRYYYDLPPELNTEEYRARADRIVSFAEGWVEGFEYGKIGDQDEES